MEKLTHLSDSAVQRAAEEVIVASLALERGLSLTAKPGRITLAGGAWVEVDARSGDGDVFVEAYARQGQLKGAQLKKIGQDILKLALLKQEAEHANAKTIIAFASQEAHDSVRGWLRRAAAAFDVELAVVSIPTELRSRILQAQSKQVMVNLDVPVAELVEDLEMPSD